jgi:hypothetical protein
MTSQSTPDTWSAGVVLLAQQIIPRLSASAIYERLGIGAFFVMSEEWWDPSIIDMHPRMPVGYIPGLLELRQRQLQRLSPLGVEMRSSWHRADESQLLQAIAHAVTSGHAVGLFGFVGSSPVRVLSSDGMTVIGQDNSGNRVTLNMQQVRAPAGVVCVIAMASRTVLVEPGDDIQWLRYLLGGLPTIAFDTPRHPLRDWQVWHIGADAFAVAALSAETAAPLAIVSDNVARIIHAYMWRIDVLQRQLERINQAYGSSELCDAIDACHDARFFMNFVAQHYPLTVARRALTLPEGSLIAETCRDTRQVLRDIADLLANVG